MADRSWRLDLLICVCERKRERDRDRDRDRESESERQRDREDTVIYVADLFSQRGRSKLI